MQNQLTSRAEGRSAVVDTPLTTPAAEPQVAPTSLWALGLPEIPSQLHFRRDHYAIPGAQRRIEVGGAVRRRLVLEVAALRELASAELDVVLECAGHRRAELRPRPRGVAWGTGAMSEARWRGTPLRTLLERAGVTTNAVEVVLEGADSGPFPGLPGEYRFARALPLEKAMHPDTLLAWEMNGEPLAHDRGGPLRAIVPGWYATDSVKWLTRIVAITEPFTGPWQERDYRHQLPGSPPPGERMTDLPIHSLITHPLPGDALGNGPVRGVAWGGGGVEAVDLRVDDGPWRPAELPARRGPYARVPWRAEVAVGPGRHVLAARATDASGRCQPERP